MLQKIKNIYLLEYPAELIENILYHYQRILNQYQQKEWQYFGNEVGQLIECFIRIIEFKNTGHYTPLKNKLPIFNEKLLIGWENTSINDSDSFRIIIPRILYSMYCIRNKRGMVHKTEINPNEMDATFLLSNSKWVLAELLRLTSNNNADESFQTINEIMTKEVSLLWDTGACLRVLDTSLSYKEKILLLLYVKSLNEKELLDATEHSNLSIFRKILSNLHKERLIEYTKEKVCTLSPKGISHVENSLYKQNYLA